jgi:hypothetical protein
MSELATMIEVEILTSFPTINIAGVEATYWTATPTAENRQPTYMAHFRPSRSEIGPQANPPEVELSAHVYYFLDAHSPSSIPTVVIQFHNAFQ